MSEQIIISGQTKQAKYEALLPQIFALTESESSWIANLANTSAALKETFGFFWVGFYLVDGDQLVLGPFQGPVACTRIAFGKGVCGASWEQKTGFKSVQKKTSIRFTMRKAEFFPSLAKLCVFR